MMRSPGVAVVLPDRIGVHRRIAEVHRLPQFSEAEAAEVFSGRRPRSRVHRRQRNQHRRPSPHTASPAPVRPLPRRLQAARHRLLRANRPIPNPAVRRRQARRLRLINPSRPPLPKGSRHHHIMPTRPSSRNSNNHRLRPAPSPMRSSTRTSQFSKTRKNQTILAMTPTILSVTPITTPAAGVRALGCTPPAPRSACGMPCFYG